MAECPGVYRLSSMLDGGLARIRIPGGRLTAVQFRAIARLAATYGNGQIDLTNRANLQIRGLDFNHTQRVEETLRDCNLLCTDPDADRLRNITASPLAGIDEREIFDVSPFVDQLDDALQNSAAAHKLSVKFAFVIDGGGRGNLSGIGHDIGFFAYRQTGLFAVSLAGKPTHHTIAATDLLAFSQAAIEHVARSGRTRLADVITNDCGPVSVLETIATSANVRWAREPAVSSENDPIAFGYHLGPSASASWFCLGVPLARLSANQAKTISDLANRGSGTLRLTPWQSIVLPGVDQSIAEDIEAQARQNALLTETPAVRVVACAGCTGCERTKADTKADGLILIEALSTGTVTVHPSPVVHLSGCSRGCAHPGTSDFLVLAHGGSANYAIHAGSRPSLTGAEPPIRTGVPPDMLAATITDLCQFE